MIVNFICDSCWNITIKLIVCKIPTNKRYITAPMFCFLSFHYNILNMINAIVANIALLRIVILLLVQATIFCQYQ